MNLQDLSREHQPIGNHFEWPVTDELRQSLQLDPDQIDFYHEHGYLENIRLLSDEQVDLLRDELADLSMSEYGQSELWYEYNSNEAVDPAKVLFHALGAWRIKPAFHDMLWHAPFVICASQLLDGAVRFWHDQLFCKPAKHGGVVAWHQDYSYWTRTRPMAHLTCWIGLDDSHRDNGCLHYIPGSHRWELLPVTGLAGDMTSIEQVLTDEQIARMHQPVAIEMKKGHCSFHHPLMVHGSYENRTDGPRRAVVLNVFRDGVVSNADEPLLHGVDTIASGEKMEGQFFPLLYDPKHGALEK